MDGWTPATPPHMLDPGQAALDHSVIAENLGIVDFDAAARSTGPKFSMLTGDGAMLELGVVNHVLGRMRSRGFMPILPPDVAHQSVIAGCGFQPRGDESNIYPLEGTDLCLSATSEIALAGMLADTILPEPATSLPRLYAAFSHCFRREAGAAGRASRGLYRLHQFSKVEMMIVCENRTCDDALAEVPERLRRQGIRDVLQRQLIATGAAATTDEAEAKVADRLGPRPTLVSDAWLEVLVGLQAGTMAELGLRGRILNMPTMELGASAHRKFDLEAWMPGRDVGDDAPPGGWGEVTSASNCTDYQARRLGIRYRDPGTGKPVFAHTLNATAAAIPRVLVALLETYQTPTGSVRLPPSCPRSWNPRWRDSAASTVAAATRTPCFRPRTTTAEPCTARAALPCMFVRVCSREAACACDRGAQCCMPASLTFWRSGSRRLGGSAGNLRHTRISFAPAAGQAASRLCAGHRAAVPHAKLRQD